MNISNVPDIKLGLNIDHVATLRNARGTVYPDPIYAAYIAEQEGVNSIVVHLREDRRHIVDRDIKLLRSIIQITMSLEIACTSEMIAIACKLKPDMCCLVPEKRQELTTEGGLDIIKNFNRLRDAIEQLADSGIMVSLFIDPDEKQISEAYNLKVSCIELHSGIYADALDDAERCIEYKRLKKSMQCAQDYGLRVNVGHGLNYTNVGLIAELPFVYELNIGHSIISRAIFCGLPTAIRDMKNILKESRRKL